MMLRFAVMCGVTERLSTASMNSSLASPCSKVWKGIETPCSISACRLSIVTMRGLEMTLPSPLLSCACSLTSRFNFSSSRKALKLPVAVGIALMGLLNERLLSP